MYLTHMSSWASVQIWWSTSCLLFLVIVEIKKGVLHKHTFQTKRLLLQRAGENTWRLQMVEQYYDSLFSAQMQTGCVTALVVRQYLNFRFFLSFLVLGGGYCQLRTKEVLVPELLRGNHLFRLQRKTRIKTTKRSSWKK